MDKEQIVEFFKVLENDIRDFGNYLDGRFHDEYDFYLNFKEFLRKMDKQIRKIERTVKKDNKKEEKQLKSLEKADKKRDKECEYGEKMMKKKKKK